MERRVDSTVFLSTRLADPGVQVSETRLIGIHQCRGALRQRKPRRYRNSSGALTCFNDRGIEIFDRDHVFSFEAMRNTGRHGRPVYCHSMFGATPEFGPVSRSSFPSACRHEQGLHDRFGSPAAVTENREQSTPRNSVGDASRHPPMATDLAGTAIKSHRDLSQTGTVLWRAHESMSNSPRIAGSWVFRPTAHSMSS